MPNLAQNKNMEWQKKSEYQSLNSWQYTKLVKVWKHSVTE